jgi:hypothetical protein
VLVAFGLWLVAGVVTGLYFAADGGHGGKPSVILASVVAGLVILVLDAMLIRRLLRGDGRRPA